MGPFPSLFLLIHLLFLLLWEDVVDPGQIVLGEDEVQQPSDNDEAQDLQWELGENGRLRSSNLGTVVPPQQPCSRMFSGQCLWNHLEAPTTIIHQLPTLDPAWLSPVAMPTWNP